MPLTATIKHDGNSKLIMECLPRVVNSMHPLKGVVISVTKNKAVILCENGDRLTTTYTKDLEFGVEVEIFFEVDTMKITKIRRISPDRELFESEILLPTNEESAISDDSLTEKE